MKPLPALTLSAGFLSLLAGPALAQVSRNCLLQARLKPSLTQKYNDIWGYLAPGGKEYALLGSSRGIFVYDCTNPKNPIQRAFLAGPWSSWRDLKTYGAFAYVVTEGGGGMQILDLRNPDSPKLVKTWGSTIWSRAHNIAMDFERGHAYVCGTGGRTTAPTHIIDVGTNPTSPVLLGNLGSIYVHDLAVQNGIAHLSELYMGRYTLVDVSNPKAAKRLGSVLTPGRFTHSTWPTMDDNICATTDERANGQVAFYDIRNRTSPLLLSTYHAGPSTSIPHNAILRNRIAYISHYTEGLRVVDISDPRKPLEVGFYDTWSGTSSGYKSNWGVYPFTDSGNVYLSDIQQGLWVVKPTASPAFYGKGTAGTGGGIPEIHNFGAAFLGNANFKIGVRKARPSSTAIFLLSAKKASVSSSGLTLNVDLLNAPSLVLPSSTDSRGALLVPLPVPADTRLAGASLFAQFLVVDPGGSLGFSASRGMDLALFKR